MSTFWRRLQHSFGFGEPSSYDPPVPVKWKERLTWIFFGQRWYLQALRYWFLVPSFFVALFLLVLISRTVSGWVYCAPCRACTAAIPQDKCGAFHETPLGPLFCLKSGFVGLAPRLRQTIRKNTRVTFFNPQDPTDSRETFLTNDSDIPCLTKLLNEYHFPYA